MYIRIHVLNFVRTDIINKRLLRTCFRIFSDGDPNSDFMIEDDGNVLLARQLDYETRKEYNLTIAVTDGVYTTATQLFVSVKDINEYRPRFSQDMYEVNVTENAEIGSPVVRLVATDDDQDLRLLFGIHSARHINSVKSFAVDYQSGVVSVQQPLDRYYFTNKYFPLAHRFSKS